MTSTNSPAQQNNYDPRWFIWTIVFLVVTGISLVSYIVLSDNEVDTVSASVVAHPAGGYKTPASASMATAK